MKITPITSRDPYFAAYTESMVSELKKTRTIKNPSAIQCASTKATLDRDPSLDEIQSKRSIDLSKAIAPHPSTIERKISPDEYTIHERSRRSAKNYLGCFEGTSPSEEAKQLAVEAFTYSPPAPLTESQKQVLVEIEQITELASLPPEEKEGFLKRILNLFRPRPDPSEGMSYAELQRIKKILSEEEK